MQVQAAEATGLDDAAAGAGTEPRWWPNGWWLLPPLVMAVAGGVLLARGHGLWFDELYTAEVAPLAIGDIARAVAEGEGTIPYLRDAPPSYNAPYYVVVHLWLAVTGLGADEVGLRLLSLFAAVAGVAVFTRAAGRLAASRGLGLVAGLIVATNPFVVEYAGEARAYALAFLFVSLAALGLARWLDGTRGGLGLYALACAAAGLAHWFALLVPLGLALAAVILRRRAAVPIVMATVLGAVPVLVIAGVAVANGVGTSGAEWIRGVGAGVPRLFLQSWTGGQAALLVATAVASGAALLACRKEPTTAATVAMCWVGLPLAVVAGAELVRPVYVDRYLLPAATGIALLMAIGCTRFPRRASFASVVAAVTVVAVSVSATTVELRQGPKDDVRSAVDALAARHHPGQPVVAAARWDALGLDHYARHRQRRLLPDLVLPPAPPPTSGATVWVLRRASDGVKGDASKLVALDRDLARRGLSVQDELRFDGRYADVIVQRWEPEQMGGA